MADDKLIHLSNLLDEKLAASEKRVISEVGKFIEDSLFPLIGEKADKADIDRIEGKLDLTKSWQLGLLGENYIVFSKILMNYQSIK